MGIDWTSVLLGVIIVEAITNIITKSGVFLRVREFFICKEDSFFVFRFLSDMLQCSYCFSVWAGWFTALLLNIKLDFNLVFSTNSFILSVISYFFSGIILHRLSNILHIVIDFVTYSVVKPSEELALRESEGTSKVDNSQVVVRGFVPRN